MLLDWLSAPRTTRGIHVACDDGTWRFTPYARLAVDARRIARRLRAEGAGRGRVVSLVLDDPYRFISAFMGTLLAGAVPAPLAPPTALRGTERYHAHLGRVFRAVRPELVLTEDDHAAVVRRGLDGADRTAARLLLPGALASPGTPDDPGAGTVAGEVLDRPDGELALIQFTSGSTGDPKGVRVTWGSLAANAEACRRWLGWTDEDSFASWLPLHHDMGLIGGMVMPVATGTDVWLMRPHQFLRSPLRWLECLGRRGATLTTAPGFGYAYAARRVRPEQLTGMDFSRWRGAVLGAERIDSIGVADFTALLGPHGFAPRALVGAYGLAETTVAASGVPAGRGSRLVRIDATALRVGEPVAVRERAVLGEHRVGGEGWLTGCGVTVHGSELTVVDASGAELPAGSFGEIRLRGRSLADGYQGATGARVPFAPDGLRTGDAGFVEDGELYVVGRIGESVTVQGTSLYAEDVEADLKDLREPGAPVGCAVAFGSAQGADHVVVFVEGRVTPDWLAAARARVSARTPDTLRMTFLQGSRGSISRTSSGKPRRRTMWELLLRPGTGPRWTVACGSPPVPAPV
ncbi:AMP-binding protein [Streptomyces sp. NPDC002454]|uniref:AMP-binding protein n=1 Tax=Streptomyces sp. NPDC002490 TaxID=3154416 RepID=UPI00332704C2